MYSSCRLVFLHNDPFYYSILFMKHSLLSIDSDSYVKSLSFYKFIFINSELNLSKIQLGFPIFVYAITIHLVLQTANLGLSIDPPFSLPSPGLSMLFLKCSLNLCPHIMPLALFLIRYFNSFVPRWLTVLNCYLKFLSPSNAYPVSQPIENLFTSSQNLLGDQ